MRVPFANRRSTGRLVRGWFGVVLLALVIALGPKPRVAHADNGDSDDFHLGPRFGISDGYVFLVGWEAQYRHVGLLVGAAVPDHELTLEARYYLRPRENSWAFGAFFWHAEAGYQQTLFTGLNAIHRWGSGAGWSFDLGGGVGYRREAYEPPRHRVVRESICVVATIMIGYSF
jgi:hypothetical protein